MLSLSLYCIEKTAHLSMLFTGLLMLQEQGRLRLSWEIDQENRRQYPYAQLLGVYGEGKCLLFDMADGYGEVELRARRRLAEQADFLFRRSFSAARIADLPSHLQARIHPFGLHYHVSWPGNPMDEIGAPREWREALFQRVFNGRGRAWFTPDRFEGAPRRRDSLRILFYTRLWDPARIPALRDSLEVLNRNRIRLVAELRKRYGPRFIGGIQFSPYALRQCRELVTDIPSTRRKNYLEALRGADICVGSTGLHGSIGWKTAEYVAAAKAIVCERFQYELPAGFQEGVHYLPFTDTDACLEQAADLMQDPGRVYAMSRANSTYYQEHLRPDRIMEEALGRAFPGFGRAGG